MAIRVLIVEDKALIAEDVASRLRKHGLDVAGVLSSGEEAVAFVKNESVDLILMDIQLAGAMDGISAAHIIQRERPTPLIYLTDFADQKTFDRAKFTGPVNYITKPFNEVELLRAVDMAFQNRLSGQKEPETDHVFIRTDSQAYQKVMTDDILYLKAERAYSRVVTDKFEYTLSTSMNHVADQLPHSRFMKIHRSYVINIKRITSIDGNRVMMGKAEVQMSQEHREELMAALNILK